MALNVFDTAREPKMPVDGVVAELHWLAFLVTGRPETSVDLVIETINSEAAGSSPPDCVLGWRRRSIISKALAIIQDHLAASARRTGSSPVEKGALPARGWVLDHGTTKSELERALLCMDVFPRAAVLLSVFEGVPIRDAAMLLGADPELVRKGQMIGLRELTANLARIQGWAPTDAASTQPSGVLFAGFTN